MSFSGFLPADFAAFDTKKWASNAYNLERRRVKDKLAALTAATREALGDALAGLDLELSDEHPSLGNDKRVDSLWAYFYRDAEQRRALQKLVERTDLSAPTALHLATQDKHACLSLVVHQGGVRAEVVVHGNAGLDRANLVKRLESELERKRLAKLLSTMPADVGVGLGAELQPAPELAEPTLIDLGVRLASSKEPFRVGLSFSAAQALELGPALAERVRDAVATLLPALRYAAWTRDADFTAVTETLKQEKKERRQKPVGLQIGDEVRVISGLFSGKHGLLKETDNTNARVLIGQMTVLVACKDLVPKA